MLCTIVGLHGPMEERKIRLKKIIEEEKHLEKLDGNACIQNVAVDRRLLNLNPAYELNNNRQS
jgi:hypothetical protein